jgi:hypothetical protein
MRLLNGCVKRPIRCRAAACNPIGGRDHNDCKALSHSRYRTVPRLSLRRQSECDQAAQKGDYNPTTDRYSSCESRPFQRRRIKIPFLHVANRMELEDHHVDPDAAHRGKKMARPRNCDSALRLADRMSGNARCLAINGDLQPSHCTKRQLFEIVIIPCGGRSLISDCTSIYPDITGAAAISSVGFIDIGNGKTRWTNSTAA